MVTATQTTARPQQYGTIGAGAKISDAKRLLFLRIALIVTGLTFIFGIYTFSIVWPSGWAWGHGHSHYLMMILGVYATLGVFLLIAAKDPYAHKSLIWFTVWSSVVHGAIMGVEGVTDPAERGHLVGDVPALRGDCTCSVNAADRAGLSVTAHSRSLDRILTLDWFWRSA